MYSLRFYRYIRREKKNYDAVFVHMNPIYIVQRGLILKLWGKKIALWYTHKAVDWKLRVAAIFADIIFTAAEDSFTLKTTKKMVVGHGIDVDKYADQPRTKVIGDEPISIISVGRITPIKNCDTLIEVARILKDKWVLKNGQAAKFNVTFIGSPVTAGDRKYSTKVKDLVKKYGLEGPVSFIGDVKPNDMPAKYAAADITVNLTPTGGLDKVVLESMAAGVPVFTSNKAFASYLSDKLIFREGDAEDLAGKIMVLCARTDSLKAIGIALQKTARERADVSALISRLSEKIKRLL
jgi:glycosyltransferase involved in cell wall biosynthesis